MVKKIITLCLVFSMFMTHANAAASQSLKTIFDELSYSLNVEWDQKDKSFYDAQMKKFTEQLKELQIKGLSNQDLIEFAKAQVKNEKVAQNVEAALNLIQINKMKPEEARKFALDMVAKSYVTGANYSSSGVAIVAVVLVVALVAVAIAAGGNVYVSTPASCYDAYVCDDYYDIWGYYLYSDCYYQTYCY